MIDSRGSRIYLAMLRDVDALDRRPEQWRRRTQSRGEPIWAERGMLELRCKGEKQARETLMASVIDVECLARLEEMWSGKERCVTEADRDGRAGRPTS